MRWHVSPLPGPLMDTLLKPQLTGILNIACSVWPLIKQQSPMGILTGRSDPPHPLVSQMLVRSCTNMNRRDEKCDCVTQYFDYSVTR